MITYFKKRQNVFTDGFGCTKTHDVQLVKHKTFVFKLERRLKRSPEALRVVHGQLWVCYRDSMVIHSEQELSLLEEEELVSLSYPDKSGRMKELADIYDVAGTSYDEFAVAAGTGLFVCGKVTDEDEEESCKC